MIGNDAATGDNGAMWPLGIRTLPNSYPRDFHMRNIRLGAALAVADLSPHEIAHYFWQNLDVANDLLTESYDKRFAPSSFIKKIAAVLVWAGIPAILDANARSPSRIWQMLPLTISYFRSERVDGNRRYPATKAKTALGALRLLVNFAQANNDWHRRTATPCCDTGVHG